MWRLRGRERGRGACGVDGHEHELAAAVCDDAREGHARVCGAYFDRVEVVVELGPGVLDDAEARLGVVAGDLRAFDACLCFEDGFDGGFWEGLGLAVVGAGGRGGLGCAGLRGRARGMGKAGKEAFCLLCATLCTREVVAEVVGVAKGVGEEGGEGGGGLAGGGGGAVGDGPRGCGGVWRLRGGAGRCG